MSSGNKRGSHVGMILSFVIFITFIVFLYSVMRPIISTGEQKKSSLDYIRHQIEYNVSAEFTSISIKIFDNPSRDCVRLEDFFLYSMIPIAKMIVKEETGAIENAYYSPVADLDDFRLDRADKQDDFFRIYYSPGFAILNNTTGMTCELVKYAKAYNITSIVSDAYVIEGKVYKIIDYYNTNYENLKKEWNIPPGSEFAFGFTRSNGTKTEVGNVSRSTSVFADETPVQYIDEGANIQSGFISVKVW